jgi:hypothetical protein
MEEVPIKKIADELGLNKDYALRLVKKLGQGIGITPHYGKRNALYLSRSDADRLINAYKPRRASSAANNDAIRTGGFGYFYIIQLHPEDLPHRFKIGYTDNLDVRQSDHRTIAPTLKLVKSWPCKRTWEDAAKASITNDYCEHLGGEVYYGDAQIFIDRAEAFFAIMPQPKISKDKCVDNPQ